MTLYELQENIKTAVQEAKEYAGENFDLGEAAWEIADDLVPVYTGDILELAYEHHDFALLIPESGPAYDGTPTPLNIIAANIFEYIANYIMTECDV